MINSQYFRNMNSLRLLALLPLLCTLIFFSCNSNETGEVIANKDSIPQNDSLNEQQRLIADLDKRIVSDPDNPNHYHARAFAYFRLAQYSEAMQDIERCIRIDSTIAIFHYTKGEILFAELKVEEALQSYRAALRQNPNYFDAEFRIGRIHMYIKSWNEAMKHINAGLKLNPNFAEGYFMKGEVYEELRDTAKAASSFQTAVEQDPNYYEAYIRLGLLYANAHNKLALDYYNSALSIRPNSVEALYDKAIFMQDHGMIADALSTYDKIIEINPRLELPWFNKGYIHLVETANYNEALVMFDKAIEINPRYIDAWHNRGLTYEGLKNYPKARENFKKALELDPTYDLSAEAMDRLDRMKK